MAESLSSRLRVPGGLGMVYGRYLQTENEPEAVINLRLAQSLGLAVGDELAVTIDASGEAAAVAPTAGGALPRGSGRLRIVGVCTNYAINQVFVSLHAVAAAAGTAALCRGGHRAAASACAGQPGRDAAFVPRSRSEARLRALPQVARVVPWQPIASISLLGCDALVGFVRLYGNLGGAVALFLIFTVILVGVSDRRGEYALLRSLGFSDLDLLRCVLAEVVLLTLCSAPAVRARNAAGHLDFSGTADADLGLCAH